LTLFLVLLAGSFLFLDSRLAPVARAQVRKAPYVSLTPQQAKELIETRTDLQLVDVRTEREFKTGALPGSTLVPYNSWFKADFMKKMQRFDKKKPILLVCAVGGRSSEAAYNLAGDGFVEVYNLSGGLSAWARQRVPLPRQNPQ
jgi:rhodanese-related sulfurtransferase